MLTFLEYARPVDLEDAGIILVLLVETHVCGSVAPYRSNMQRGREGQWKEVVLALTSGAVEQRRTLCDSPISMSWRRAAASLGTNLLRCLV
jgi:hypothetical protein